MFGVRFFFVLVLQTILVGFNMCGLHFNETIVEQEDGRKGHNIDKERQLAD